MATKALLTRFGTERGFGFESRFPQKKTPPPPLPPSPPPITETVDWALKTNDHHPRPPSFPTDHVDELQPTGLSKHDHQLVSQLATGEPRLLMYSSHIYMYIICIYIYVKLRIILSWNNRNSRFLPAEQRINLPAIVLCMLLLFCSLVVVVVVVAIECYTFTLNS